MKKLTLLLGGFSLFLGTTFSQSTTKKIEREKESVVYQQNKGRIDGLYTSYYKNGKKKAEGNFENNLRNGEWTLWNSEGKVITQRNYSNPFSFKSKNNDPQSNTSPLKYNKDGYLDYFPVQEKTVTYHKRYWQKLLPNNNSILFKENKLFDLLHKKAQSNEITPYSTIDDEFTTKLDSITEFSEFNVVAFKIKEDFFYDNERNVSEKRIIGICPVIVTTQTNDTINCYWLYFPEVRKYLAQEKIQEKNLPTKIKTIDDLFFYQYFSGNIYQESSLNNNSFDNKSKSDRIKIDMIETEHNLWGHYSNEGF